MSAHPERSTSWEVVCGGHGVLRITGDMDISTEDGLRSALDNAYDRAAGRLIVDLSAVTFIDVRGLHVLLSVESRAREEGGRLALVSPPRGLSRMVDVLELTAFPAVYPSVPDAVRAGAAGGG